MPASSKILAKRGNNGANEEKLLNNGANEEKLLESKRWGRCLCIYSLQSGESHTLQSHSDHTPLPRKPSYASCGAKEGEEGRGSVKHRAWHICHEGRSPAVLKRRSVSSTASSVLATCVLGLEKPAGRSSTALKRGKSSRRTPRLAWMTRTTTPQPATCLRFLALQTRQRQALWPNQCTSVSSEERALLQTQVSPPH